MKIIIIHLICLILPLIDDNGDIKQDSELYSIHKEKIHTFFQAIDSSKNLTVDDFFHYFSTNSELEKSLFIEKSLKEGITEEKADSLFDWVILEKKDINESLVFIKLKRYFSPMLNYIIKGILIEKKAYIIYEVEVALKSTPNKHVKYFIQIGSLKNLNYSVVNIFDSNMKSIIFDKTIYCQ